MRQSHSCASSAHGQFYNSQIFRKSGIHVTPADVIQNAGSDPVGMVGALVISQCRSCSERSEILLALI